MDKKSLINLAKNISKERGTDKYFEFSSNYLMNDKIKGIKTTDKFFKMLKTCTQRTNLTTVKSAFGVRGKNSADINNWINNIIYNNQLKALSLDELYYVMSIASRYAKIYETEHNTSKNDFKSKNR